MTPLNGTKTHSLSDHARSQLRSLVDGPRPSQEINPGVINRLLREDLIEVVLLPSPYQTHRGKTINHARLTKIGKDFLDGISS